MKNHLLPWLLPEQYLCKVFVVISISAIKEWNKRAASGEGLESRTRCRKPKKIEPEKLRTYISANLDAYIREIAAEFGCARSAVQKALKKLKITRKKDYNL